MGNCNVILDGFENVELGDFVDVKIVAATEHDLIATPVK